MQDVQMLALCTSWIAFLDVEQRFGIDHDPGCDWIILARRALLPALTLRMPLGRVELSAYGFEILQRRRSSRKPPGSGRRAPSSSQAAGSEGPGPTSTRFPAR